MMNKSNLIIAAAISLFMISTPACSEGEHHNGEDHNEEGHHHQKNHDDHHSNDDHHAGKAGNYASVSVALTALKTALSETESAVKANKLESVHEIFPEIESSAAYLHDNAVPKSEDFSERLHGAIDQLMDVVAQMHDASHGVDKASTSRMLKKLNGSLQWVEAYLSTEAKPTKAKEHGSHDHGHGSHQH